MRIFTYVYMYIKNNKKKQRKRRKNIEWMKIRPITIRKILTKIVSQEVIFFEEIDC